LLEKGFSKTFPEKGSLEGFSQKLGNGFGLMHLREFAMGR